MKIQEAIEILSEALRCSVYTNGEDWKALELVADASKKQILKRIIQSEWNSLILDCPTCEASLYNCESDNHCYNCGQAIDWSTDEN